MAAKSKIISWINLEEIINVKNTIRRQPDHVNFEQVEAETSVAELCREHGMRAATFYL